MLVSKAQNMLFFFFLRKKERHLDR